MLGVRTAEDAGLAAEAEVKTFTKTLRPHLANSSKSHQQEFATFAATLGAMLGRLLPMAQRPSSSWVVEEEAAGGLAEAGESKGKQK